MWLNWQGSTNSSWKSMDPDPMGPKSVFVCFGFGMTFLVTGEGPTRLLIAKCNFLNQFPLERDGGE
jgi:hypothetical protein